MWPPSWPVGAIIETGTQDVPGICVEIRAGEHTDGVVVSEFEGRIRFSLTREPDENVELERLGAAAMAMTIDWLLTARLSPAAERIVCAVNGEHSPVRVTQALGNSNIVISATSPIGRPWQVSLEPLMAGALKDCLMALAGIP